MESDLGAFKPFGLAFSGSAAAADVMQGVLALLAPINASTLLANGNGYETDTAYWEAEGVPGASLASHNERYFNFHHSQGDQMSVLDPGEMDLAAAVFAVTAYVVADLDGGLPRADANDDGGEKGVDGRQGQGLLRGGSGAAGTATVA